MLTDAHTHHSGRANALICVPPERFMPEEGFAYTMGIHPWEAGEPKPETLAFLAATAVHPAVRAIGETGIDKMRGAPEEWQTAWFDIHIRLSEQLRKPLVLHAVKALDEILDARKRRKPEMPWIWHGFRGNTQTAATLVGRGFYLSIGERFNGTAVKAIPDSRLLVETDESLLPIEQIADKVAAARGTDTATILRISSENLRLLSAGR